MGNLLKESGYFENKIWQFSEILFNFITEEMYKDIALTSVENEKTFWKSDKEKIISNAIKHVIGRFYNVDYPIVNDTSIFDTIT